MLIAKYGADNKSTKLAVRMEQVVLTGHQSPANTAVTARKAPSFLVILRW